MACRIRDAVSNDLTALLAIENRCFDSDKISQRSFKRYLVSEHSKLLVAENDDLVVGYVLIWLHKGTRLGRIYSLAVLPEMRGKGIAEQLLTAIESVAKAHKRFYIRLEVAAKNQAAINLYEKLGYRVFGRFAAYYADSSDALRMQKRIRANTEQGAHLAAPWFRQTTEFTCGPASLIMAMSALAPKNKAWVEQELAIWREATTIFMTSGHGGCHPFGLALAAHKRGFISQVMVNTDAPLFIDSVRDVTKKQVIERVHDEMLSDCQHLGINISYQELNLEWLQAQLLKGHAVIVLISTYRFDGMKAPHWVLVTGIDDECVYVHDPDVNEPIQSDIDCQHLPVAIEAFQSMAAFGIQRLKTAVVVANQK
ncbi:ribosomal protein S18-alanine N-acetyltransferase [Pseudoalteromonas spongiae]|uniref:Ribosomal protein S18-alanine N-acetyltransferase n=1 Tax=Pseudoalteromonas spongiae TaxID=298657 RepID=A0ABU8EXJ0_9GAMM